MSSPDGSPAAGEPDPHGSPPPVSAAAPAYNAARTASAAAALKARSAASGKSGNPNPAPDFGPGDKVVPAWSQHRINDDQLVRYGVQNLIGSKDLPAEFRPDKALGEEAAGYQAFLFEHLTSATPQTKAWVNDLFSVKKAGAKTATATTAATSLAADLPDDPKNACGTVTIYLADQFQCLYVTEHANIYYNIERTVGDPDHGGYVEPGLKPEFNRSSDTPDAVYKMAEGLESAWKTYQAMGFVISLPAGPLDVWVGHSSAKDGAGVAFPFEFPGAGHNPTILLPQDMAVGAGNPVPINFQFNYLPRHELFHCFQYHYMPNADFVFNLGATNWWMEASAEWATHKSFEADPSYDGEARENEYYARNLAKFLGSPGRAINAWDGFGNSRQYSVNPLAEYLTERTDNRFVRLTWEVYSTAGGKSLDAIKAVMSGYGLDANAAMLDFAVANYRLSNPVSAWSPQTQAWVTAPGYTDPQASTTWRGILADGNVGTDSYAGGRPAHGTAVLGGLAPTWNTGNLTAELQPGGAFYVDLMTGFQKGKIGDQGVLQVHVDPKPNLRYSVVTWRGSGSTTGALYPAINETYSLDASGNAYVRVSDPSMVATLVVARVDLVAEPSDAVNNKLSFGWNASVTQDVVSPLTVDGDPGAVVSSVPGLHAWFTVPVAANQTFYVASRGKYDANVTLRAPWGSKMGSGTAYGGMVNELFTGAYKTGFYTLGASPGVVYLEAVPSTTGQLDVSLRALDVNTIPTATAVVEGAPVTVATTKWGQRAKLRFSVPVGQTFYLAGSSAVHSVYETQQVPYYPVDSWLEYMTNGTKRHDIGRVLTSAGTGDYAVDIRPTPFDPTDAPFPYELRVLSTVVKAAATPNGSVTTVDMSTWGRRAQITFPGTAGQKINVDAANIGPACTFGPGLCSGSAAFWNPYNPPYYSTLAAVGGLPRPSTPPNPTGQRSITGYALPTTGTQTLELGNQQSDSAKYTIAIYP
ncbi:hypothetical protein [Yinghuangia seranimata]|uniref:hypothetical protein n=1 Tax=Yinghuangia seranimata TaxID=408067 RepID=UPI00248C43AA|nr:hypothetical protein [Yinghuangia seranimata]MDI2131509.1 hypothetical protein [Yinghuangia seranimata]